MVQVDGAKRMPTVHNVALYQPIGVQPSLHKHRQTDGTKHISLIRDQ